MGYFPGTLPGGGDGISSLWSTIGQTLGPYNGTLMSLTLAADTKFVHFRFYSSISGGYTNPNKVGYSLGEAFIDCSDHSFKVCTGGARLALSSPPEYIGTETKTLLGNLPGVLFSSTEHILRISAYTGPGNNISVYAYSVSEESINATSGKINLLVNLSQYRGA